MTVRRRVHTRFYQVIRATSLTICLIAGCAVLFALFGRYLFEINLTRSAPVGLYIRTHDPDAPYATFCLNEKERQDAKRLGFDEPGMCPDGSIPLLKLVYRPEQIEAFTPDGFIDRNGKPVDQTAPKPASVKGLPLNHIPFGPVSAPPGTFWALSHNKDGYDSRYFGPVDRNQILFYSRPGLTF